MITDFLFFKILIVIVVIAILLVGFYFTMRFIKIAFKTEVNDNSHDIDDFLYHFDQLEDVKKLQSFYSERYSRMEADLTKLSKEREVLEKKYEEGIFYRRNLAVFKCAKAMFEDLRRWRMGSYAVTKDDIDAFLDDIEGLMSELGVKLIKPKVDDYFDSREMKSVGVISNFRIRDNTVGEVVKYGYKIRLKNRERILSEAEVKVNRS